MDITLQAISHTICYTDDVLVTVVNNQEHLTKPEVSYDDLHIMALLSKRKSVLKSVEYPGHVIDSQGLHVKQDKVDAIVNAPKPKSITELRAYLGLLNYFGKHIPNLGSILQHPHTIIGHILKERY